MRNLALLLCCFLVTQSIIAQNLAGSYFIAGQGGTINLELKPSPNGLQGSLVDMNGIQYNVQAEVEDGEAFGTLRTQQGTMYFEAFREDMELYLTLIPTDATGQPDPSGAQEFIMTAQNNNSSPIAATPSATPSPNRGTNEPANGMLSRPLGGASNAGAVNWPGTFSGNVMGTATTLNLDIEGKQLSGIVDAGGYRYKLQGTISGNQSQGKLEDPQTQGYLDYTATLNGTQLNLTISNPTNGQSQQATFSRGHTDNRSNMPGQVNNSGPDTQQSVNRDSRLVGAWNYTDSYSSGAYSFATQWKLLVNPDGSYVYGDGRVVGGGPGIGGDSGSGGDVTRGQWKTENGVLYINTGEGWQGYARYTTNGQSMLMQFADGSKQLWKRTN